MVIGGAERITLGKHLVYERASHRYTRHRPYGVRGFSSFLPLCGVRAAHLAEGRLAYLEAAAGATEPQPQLPPQNYSSSGIQSRTYPHPGYRKWQDFYITSRGIRKQTVDCLLCCVCVTPFARHP